ncbi:oligoendopeptidase, pepF/M3 family [Alkalibacterium subtropicum]|uniref:Oligoendopeptidase, pepF/M3 family n=1 Tax=Alkalibacterium subtropicum TaxID=753702 RepID=A0A1I1GZ83_9LACT|nr:M3 family oligoendopeptidase [Alkalibacterium subtropicum]SFC14250.1 oligoendopeptidase, pepF/M3 family [Alkalibacterium subtropicum]
MTASQNWNMDSVFEGGSHSEALQSRIKELDTLIQATLTQISAWQPSKDHPEFNELAAFLENRETIGNGLSEAGTFARGLFSANTKDLQAAKVVNQLSTVASQMSEVETLFMKKLKDVPEDEWNTLVATEPFKQSAFPLQEKREKGQKLLSEKEEKIIQKLSLDGLNGFGNMYQTIVNSVSVPFEEDGKIIYLSAGQAANKLTGSEDPAVRARLLKDWEMAWKEKAPLFSDTLNHLAGFRLQTYDLRDEKDFLTPPLEYNRMKEETLNTMWDTITENKPKVVTFLNRKAALMGKDKLNWADVTAPVSVGDYEPKTYSFEEAQDFVTTHFGTFSQEMQDMAQRAFDEGWVEAEDKEGKRPGAYCSNLPESKQSRIFMTFSGSANNVSTLAHELGHAYHSHVMRDLPALNRSYAMNVAETASTFAEMLISDATVEAAASEEEKIALLDSKISRAAIMFMNIHSRFLFEKRFYEARQNGLVNEEELSTIMEEAQKEAFLDSLDTYHPTFWASKLHFYITGISFYNFPYTFGFLFSLGIYSKAKQEGQSFSDNYRNLLRDTASMTTEDLAEKHLAVDLTQPDFWQSAIDEILTDIDEYLALTADRV